MVSCRRPITLGKLTYGYFTVRHSPLEKTPHKTCNGELSITCRNRHCPKCQANARDRWLAAREQELLRTRYVHVVFTLPRQLSPLAMQNKREIYALLFRASAETLSQVARDPKHLGAEIGFFSVLHTWNEAPTSSPCPLRGARRWSFTGSLTMDRVAAKVFPPGRCSQKSIPRQIRGRPEDTARGA